MDESATALERFRQQWREEVSARSRNPNKEPVGAGPSDPSRRLSEGKPERPINRPTLRHPAADIKDEVTEHDKPGAQAQDTSSGLSSQVEKLSVEDVDEDEFNPPVLQNPQTALEHFEKAIEREGQGNLGDSLDLYRKAYKLDAKVDQTYKNKHFPTKSKPTDPNPSNAPVTVPNTAHHSSSAASQALPVSELIQSFAGDVILGVDPIIPGDRVLPCTISELPNEVLVDMLRQIGTVDPALLARFALVCRKLAYHIYTENSLWKSISLGSQFGLSSQQYKFATDLQWREAIYQTLEDGNDPEVPPINEAIFPKDVSWRDVFHSHPRIRFSGVYISTVNYTRPGGASATQYVWSNPIHIVTYYRYLRFFRDGTCISLLTTNEPVDVVHHLTKENLNLARSKGTKEPMFLAPPQPPAPNKDGTIPTAPPPTAQNTMKHALRGRWRLGHPTAGESVTTTTSTDPVTGPPQNSNPDPSASSFPSLLPEDIHIETEGAGPRYMYTMHLSLKHASRSRTSSKNTKLVWKGFWSYNILTDDWAVFPLKNDKAFWFSRVKRYGLGY